MNYVAHFLKDKQNIKSVISYQTREFRNTYRRQLFVSSVYGPNYYLGTSHLKSKLAGMYVSPFQYIVIPSGIKFY